MATVLEQRANKKKRRNSLPKFWGDRLVRKILFLKEILRRKIPGIFRVIKIIG